MARRRQQSSSSVEEESSCGGSPRLLQPQQRQLQSTARRSPRKKLPATYRITSDSETEQVAPEHGLQRKITSSKAASKPNLVKLAPATKVNAFLSAPVLSDPKPTRNHLALSGGSLLLKQKQYGAPQRSQSPSLNQPSNDSIGNETTIDFDESIWCGSDASQESSEDELPSPRKLLNFNQRQALPKRSQAADFTSVLDGLKDLDLNVAPSPARRQLSTRLAQDDVLDASKFGSISDRENDDGAILRFTPPRLLDTSKSTPLDRPTTPPPVSPSKLKSPSKTKTRIPTPPLRQSLDAFWNASTVNEWNDQYSPQKTVRSPTKNRRPLQPHSPTSPSSLKLKSQSPVKRNKAEVAAEKDFEARKRHLAEHFLAELDDKITGGAISRLSASTGGVRIVWSKTLNSTAGRANWRRETVRTISPTTSVGRTAVQQPTTTVEEKHHASIELATKVIATSEHRLLNVLAHEFCHLANFMVSGIKDQPHGRSFKAWGAKCSAAFGNRGVHVTTKHSYEIEYRYVWRCKNEDECGVEFKRHSKSIDPKRHRCGTCKAELMQVRPVPRAVKQAEQKQGGGNGTVGGFAGFVKLHFADIKKEMPGASHKEVMEAVGRHYRAEKEQQKMQALTHSSSGGDDGTSSMDVDAVAERLGIVALDS